MSREVKLNIGGQDITVKSDEETEYLESLAAFVGERMREVGKGRDSTTTLSLALAAALSIADDLRKLGQSSEGIDAELDGVSDTIEASLEADQG